jgi:hypothetical protein
MKIDVIRSNIFGVPFGELTPTGLSLPDNLGAEQWQEVGLALGNARGGLMWAIGDWWAFGEHRYGERAAIVNSEDWEGPGFQSCRDAATVCRAFETSRRRDILSYATHREIASIDDEEWRLKTLDWVEEKQPKREVIRQRVREVKSHLAQGWTQDQAERKAAVESGICVVATMRDKTDAALLAWAEASGRLERIDRQSEWGNPFEMPVDGDRAEVVGKFRMFYLPNKPGLLAKMPTLRGKVLACWCHPEECHGDIIAEVVNSEGDVIEIVERIADRDG